MSNDKINYFFNKITKENNEQSVLKRIDEDLCSSFLDSGYSDEDANEYFSLNRDNIISEVILDMVRDCEIKSNIKLNFREQDELIDLLFDEWNIDL